VTKSGGHSPWSSIGQEGVVVDLAKIQEITINKSNEMVTITGSVLSKQVSVALAAEGLFTRVCIVSCLWTMPRTTS
jgi:FAD/FMN-containing dehydrogenase